VSADGCLHSPHKAEVEGDEAEATGLVGPPDGLRRPNACLAEHLVVTTGMRSETAVRMRCAETNGVRQNRLISASLVTANMVGLAGLEPAASFSISAITAYRHAVLPFRRSCATVRGEGMRSYDWPLLDGAVCRISYVRRTLAKISQASSDLATRLRVM
jgi:hypothetical protein